MVRAFSGCSRSEEAMQEAYEEARRGDYQFFGLCYFCTNYRACEFQDDEKKDVDDCEFFEGEED